MQTIWRFDLTLEDGLQEIPMPHGAEVLSTNYHNRRFSIWASVESENSPSVRLIQVHGTGHPVNGGRYTGSVLQGAFVWHVFDHGWKQ